MFNRIFIFFLPGCAGNFFTRALGLSSNQCYGYVPEGTFLGQGHLTLEEKFAAFSYKDYKQHGAWTEFEKKLIPQRRVTCHTGLPIGSYSIWTMHPSYQILEKNSSDKSVQCYIFYIDPEDKFEWSILNAFYKDTYIDVKWLKDGKKMLDDPNIHKLSLSNIVDAKDTCIQEIKKVANIAGFELHQENLTKVAELWEQWHATTLKKEDFAAFKTQIGFNM